MSDEKGKEYKVVASKILGCTLASYYNWDKQGRPIISLLEKYFTKEDLEEFLESGVIERLETDKKLENRVASIEKHISWFMFKELWAWLYVAHGEIARWALANYKILSRDTFYKEFAKEVQEKNIVWKGKDITAYSGIIFYNLHKDDI